MEVLRLHYPLPSDFTGNECVLAMGYFDGVHLGHGRVIQKAIDKAHELGIQSAVMTFDPHPREILGQSGYTRYLTPLDEKLTQFEKMGVDLAYIVHFDISFSSIYPEDFIDEFLLRLQPRHVVVGFDYTFGHKGIGTATTLQQLSDGRYGVEVVSPINRFGEKVSSTLIREYLYNGQIHEANHFLGRAYRFKGTVVHGEKRGRTIGFPTANIGLTQPYIIPKNGVYGVKVFWNKEEYEGVINIGIKPTFENQRKEKSLEVHLLHFSGDLYGEELEVEFLFYIRDEQKFAVVDELVQQINEDVETAKVKFTQFLA
ncbi:MAG TPA: bifunctional riboflavin kinase/FAD synthetase [Paenibacillaceae bacterium]|nr:bifunctional riboflavin kinase/FAD synthetase [Paenibacillaceae bacterium]